MDKDATPDLLLLKPKFHLARHDKLDRLDMTGLTVDTSNVSCHVET